MDGSASRPAISALHHLALTVGDDLDRWAARLDALGIEHGGVTDVAEPVPYSALVFRDPDTIQLEFVHLPG